MGQPIRIRKIDKVDTAIYPASESLYKRALTEEEFKAWKETISYKDLNLEFDKRLRPYQKEGINKLLQRPSFAVFDEQRLGKTPMVLSSLKYRNVNKVIIIAPKSLLLSWEQECKKWIPELEKVVIIKGTKDQRKKLYKSEANIMIINYNTVSNDLDLLPDFDCLIIDEAHRLRNFKGVNSKGSPIMTKAIVQLAYKIKYRILLTGTPAPNKPENIYPILHILYPNIFSSYYNFIDYYFETEEQYIARDQTINIVVGFKRGKDKELQSFLSLISVQRKRKDYMDWLTTSDIKEITLPLDKKERKWYNEIAKTYECEELNISCPNILSQMTTLRKLSATSKEKLNFILQYIEDYPEDQIIITTNFSHHLQVFKTELEKFNFRTEILTGKSSILQRKNYQDEFNKHNIHVLLCNSKVICEGMKLEECNTMFILDPSLTYTDNEQLHDRIIPTTKDVAELKNKQQIIYLRNENTIDMYIKEQLEQKKTATEIINNYISSFARSGFEI